jgi:hypothetical protein
VNCITSMYMESKCQKMETHCHPVKYLMKKDHGVSGA